MEKNRHGKGHVARALVIFGILIVLTSMPELGPSGEARASPPNSGSGWDHGCSSVVENSKPKKFRNDEDVRVLVWAFLSVSGHYVESPCAVSVWRGFENVSAQIRDSEVPLEPIRNITINDDDCHWLNLGKWPEGTYRLVARYTTGDGTLDQSKLVINVIHRPIRYSLALCDGEKVDFKSHEHDQNFTISIYLSYGMDRREEITRYNVSNLSYDIDTDGAQVLEVNVKDAYGWENYANAEQSYVLTYEKPPEWELYKILIVVAVFIAGILAAVFIIRRLAR